MCASARDISLTVSEGWMEPTTNLNQKNESNQRIYLTISQLAQDTIIAFEINLNEFIKLSLF